jgi:crotonobetainyl-CoA:carnitine CoA-transferase CaiB-like acyl-CoA transferase
MSASLPLSGLTVIELGTSVAVPFGANVFADLGAEVIKVERPGAGDDARMWGPPFVDGSSPIFHAINRNKRSAVVNLKDAQERIALRRFIIDRADIVLQNMRPGVVEGHGLDAASLRSEKPSLIYCNLSAFGAAGPLKAKPGYDPLMQAAGGIMSVTGLDGQDPVRVGPSIVDQGAGMWAVIGILAALHRRTMTGEGCEIGTSLYETAVNWVGIHVASHFATGKVPGRIGTENSGIAPYKAYQAQDGWLVIAAGNDGLFRQLAATLGHPEWPDDPAFRTNPDRVSNRESLNRLIAQVIADDRRDAWLAKFDAAAIPCAPVLTLDQVVSHPQTQATGMLQRAPDGPLPLVGVPLQFDGERPPLRTLPPRLGQDTALVLDGCRTEESKIDEGAA